MVSFRAEEGEKLARTKKNSDMHADGSWSYHWCSKCSLEIMQPEALTPLHTCCSFSSKWASVTWRLEADDSHQLTSVLRDCDWKMECEWAMGSVFLAQSNMLRPVYWNVSYSHSNSPPAGQQSFVEHLTPALIVFLQVHVSQPHFIMLLPL